MENELPATGLDIKEALDTLRAHAPGCTVSINLECTLYAPHLAGSSSAVPVRYHAYVHRESGMLFADAYTLPGVLTAMLDQLAK